MKVVKLTLIIGSLIILLLLSMALLLPRKISIAKSVPIQGGSDCAMEMVLKFENWPKWFPAVKEGSSSLKKISETRAEMTGSIGKPVAIELYGSARDSFGFTIAGKSNPPVQFSFFIYQEKNGGHRLDLIVNTILPWYPWERLKGVFIDKLTGPQYQLALDNIVKACQGP